jgi:hypothetical protein
MGIRIFLWKHLTSLVGPILGCVSQVSLGAKAVLTGASESASSSNKSAFGGRLNGHSHSSPKSASTYIWLWKTAKSDIYWWKILRKSIFRFTLRCSWTHFWKKCGIGHGRKSSPQKSPKGVRFWQFPQPLYIEGLFKPCTLPCSRRIWQPFNRSRGFLPDGQTRIVVSRAFRANGRSGFLPSSSMAQRG